MSNPANHSPDSKTKKAQEELSGALASLQPEDYSRRATAIRQEISELWRDVVCAESDPVAALAIAALGEEQLRPFDLAQQLVKDRAILDVAQRVHDGTLWLAHPGMSEDAPPDLPESLPALGSDLQKLRDDDRSWPALRNWAKQREQGIIARIESRFDRLLTEAREALTGSNYLGALALVEEGAALLPEGLWRNALPKKWKQLEDIRDDADAWQETRRVLKELQDDLENERLVLGEPAVRERLAAIPPPPADDPYLDRCLRGLEFAQILAEKSAAQPDEKTGYVQILNTQFASREAPTPVSPDPDWSWLTDEIAELREDLDGKILDVAGGLAEALSKEADNLSTRSDPDPSRVLSLYWQARWTLAALQDVFSELSVGPFPITSPEGPVGRLFVSAKTRASQLSSVTEALRGALRQTEGLLLPLVENVLAPSVRDAVDGKQGALQRALIVAQHLLTWRVGCTQGPESVHLPQKRGHDNYQPQPLPETKELDNVREALLRLSKDTGRYQEYQVVFDFIETFLANRESTIPSPETD